MKLPFEIDLKGKVAVVTGAGGVLCSDFAKVMAECGASVALLDTPDDIRKKFKSAVTDSEAKVRYADGKDGINNLMSIYSCCTGLDYDAIEKEFDGKGYGDFKLAVAESVIESTKPVQDKYYELMNDKAYIEKCAAEGAMKASYVANKTLSKVMKKVGFWQIKK